MNWTFTNQTSAGEVTSRLSLASGLGKHWLSSSGKIDGIFKRALTITITINYSNFTHLNKSAKSMTTQRILLLCHIFWQLEK